MTKLSTQRKRTMLRMGLLVSFLLLTALMLSFLIFDYTGEARKGFDPDLIYKTWKVEKLYNNDKVIDAEKYKNTRLKFNRDGTAEWIKLGNSQKLKFAIKEDGTQILMDNGYTLEDIETVFELTEDRLRFGKHNILSKYEYIMVPVEE